MYMHMYNVYYPKWRGGAGEGQDSQAKTQTTHLVLERLLERDLDFFLLGGSLTGTTGPGVEVSTAVVVTSCC